MPKDEEVTKIPLNIEIDQEIFADYALILNDKAYLESINAKDGTMESMITNYMIRCIHNYEHYLADMKCSARFEKNK